MLHDLQDLANVPNRKYTKLRCLVTHKIPSLNPYWYHKRVFRFGWIIRFTISISILFTKVFSANLPPQLNKGFILELRYLAILDLVYIYFFISLSSLSRNR